MECSRRHLTMSILIAHNSVWPWIPTLLSGKLSLFPQGDSPGIHFFIEHHLVQRTREIIQVTKLQISARTLKHHVIPSRAASMVSILQMRWVRFLTIVDGKMLLSYTSGKGLAHSRCLAMLVELDLTRHVTSMKTGLLKPFEKKATVHTPSEWHLPICWQVCISSPCMRNMRRSESTLDRNFRWLGCPTNWHIRMQLGFEFFFFFELRWK